MCGIAGFLYRDPERTGPIGATILGLLDVLGSHGTDGTGVALHGAPDGRGMLLRVWLGETAHPEARAVDVAERLRAVAHVEGAEVRDDYVTVAVRPPHGEAASQGAWMAALIEAAEARGAGSLRRLRRFALHPSAWGRGGAGMDALVTGAASIGVERIDCAALSTREINRALRRASTEGVLSSVCSTRRAATIWRSGWWIRWVSMSRVRPGTSLAG